MANIILTDQRCRECEAKISEYEAEEYKQHCWECWGEFFKGE